MANATESGPPVAGEARPQPRQRRQLVSAKTLAWGLGLIIAAGGATASVFASIGGKADAGKVDQLDGRVGAVERRIERIETDATWIKSALYALTLHEGVVVPPPPKGDKQ